MNCDRLARWYRWLEYLGWGRGLERRREQFLPETSDARHVLMLGEGDGRFLAAFLRANPHAEVDYVDLSVGMLALAEKRAGAAATGRVRFHHADARDLAVADRRGNLRPRSSRTFSWIALQP